MDWTKIKPGDYIEVGPQIAWREWRYRFKPFQLLSLSFQIPWSPDYRNESDPDCCGQSFGIFALKTRPERWARSCIKSAGWQDGFVIGRAALWGVVWEHELGYRGQYARPVSFDEARGERADEALERLRRLFGVGG